MYCIILQIQHAEKTTFHNAIFNVDKNVSLSIMSKVFSVILLICGTVIFK